MTKRPVDPFSRPLLWAMYASGLMLLLALSLLAAVKGTGWSWPIFVAGVVGAAVVVVLNHLTLRFAWRRMVARFQPTEERQARGRERLRKQRRFYPVPFTMAVGFAVLSAALESYWPIVLALLVWLLAVVILPLAVLPLIMRRLATTL